MKSMGFLQFLESFHGKFYKNRVVTKGQGPGISPGYSEHGPRLLSSLN